MAKFGFLSVLEEELDKHLDYDFAMDWDKKNHAVEVTFILEAQNSSNVETIDDKGEVSDEDVIFEDYVLFYNPAPLSSMWRLLMIRVKYLMKMLFLKTTYSFTIQHPYHQCGDY